ncbi:hypothetical protein Q7P37_000390 [Cladosporium fusiforme]
MPTSMASHETDSVAPVKRINDGDDLNFFLSSTAYRDIKIWLLRLNRAVFPTKTSDGQISLCTLDSPPPYSPIIVSLRSLIQDLADLLSKAPPDSGPRRFGNVAFREWYRQAEESTDALLDRHLSSTLQQYEQDPAVYLELIRKLILTYTLEPAGSHGVWGLDDHSFVPYIFGSAQLGPPIESPDSPTPLQGSLGSAPDPDTITSKSTVTEYKTSNMYFSAIQFIFDVKKGPFWEHSPILFNISGIKDGWGKINKGMIKMYDAEVLGKFPVVQHFPFGKFFKWERDPKAVTTTGGSFHAQQQPPANSGMDTAVGTAAPWARPAPAQAQSGMPLTRAPWASQGNTGTSGMPSTAAPWASTTASRMPPPGTTGSTYGRRPPPPVTEAPWKKRDG